MSLTLILKLTALTYLTNAWRRAGYAVTNAVFVCLPLVYGWVAWKGAP